LRGGSVLFGSLAVLFNQRWAGIVEKLLDLSSIAEGLFHVRNQGQGDVHGFAPTLSGEGQQPSGMFVAPGTGGAVFPDAGFIDPGQGTFEGRPEAVELLLPLVF
jgi:hypothetical protein